MTFAPLEGVRILDLTTVVVGPVTTWRLAQYGAEIIKVESPGGDLMRGLGGPSPTGQHSGAYLHLNRGKRNICLDLKNPASREIMNRLVQTSDVIIANIRPDALERPSGTCIPTRSTALSPDTEPTARMRACRHMTASSREPPAWPDWPMPVTVHLPTSRC